MCDGTATQAGVLRLLPGDAPVLGSGELRNRSIGGKLPDEGSDSVCMVRQALYPEPSLSQQDPQVCMVRRDRPKVRLLSHHAHDFGRPHGSRAAESPKPPPSLEVGGCCRCNVSVRGCRCHNPSALAMIFRWIWLALS